MKQYAIALTAVLALVSAARTPDNGPVPEEKPQAPAETAPEQAPEGQDTGSAEPPAEDMQAYRQCLSALTATGAKFRELESIGPDGSCGVERPLELTEAGDGVKMQPAATIRCETALALSRWVTESAVPTARIAFPERKISSIDNASGYVCRNRNHAENGKLSEHALGNAIDIATIVFDDGEKLELEQRGENGDMKAVLQRSLMAPACLFFRTVLSPGSDAAHGDHAHFDVMERKNGYRYCR